MRGVSGEVYSILSNDLYLVLASFVIRNYPFVNTSRDAVPVPGASCNERAINPPPPIHISFRFWKVIIQFWSCQFCGWKRTSDVHVWKIVVVRRLECLRCHMGKQRNFSQSVVGNDSRVCGDESRDASRLREYKGRKRKMRLTDSPRFSRPKTPGKFSSHCAVDLTHRGDERARLSLISRWILDLRTCRMPPENSSLVNLSNRTESADELGIHLGNRKEIFLIFRSASLIMYTVATT